MSFLSKEKNGSVLGLHATPHTTMRGFRDGEPATMEGFDYAADIAAKAAAKAAADREYYNEAYFERLEMDTVDIESEIAELLRILIGDIDDDFRATEDPSDDEPGMCVTFGTTDLSSWSYQTGDNSFTGGCYGCPYWACVYLHRDSNCAALAAEAVDELLDQFITSQEG